MGMLNKEVIFWGRQILELWFFGYKSDPSIIKVCEWGPWVMQSVFYACKFFKVLCTVYLPVIYLKVPIVVLSQVDYEFSKYFCSNGEKGKQHKGINMLGKDSVNFYTAKYWTKIIMKFCFRLSLETKLFLSLRTVIKFSRTTNFNFSIPKQKTDQISQFIKQICSVVV